MLEPEKSPTKHEGTNTSTLKRAHVYKIHSTLSVPSLNPMCKKIYVWQQSKNSFKEKKVYKETIADATSCIRARAGVHVSYENMFLGGMWTLSLVLCDALMTMDVMLCTASIFNLCAISVDRFIAVFVPLNYNRRQVDNRQLFLISTTWIFAFAVASPVIFGLNNVKDRDPTECKLEDNNYVVYSSVCSFFIPCPIMVVLYCAMFYGLRKWEETRKAKLRSHMSPRRKPPSQTLIFDRIDRIDRSPTDSKLDELIYDQPDCPYSKAYVDNGHGIQAVSYPHLKYASSMEPERKHTKINGRERKAMRVLPVVVGVFLFCWTPFFVVHITRALCESCYMPAPLFSTVTWLGYVNSALNPVIYTIFNTEFRNYFRKVLRMCC
ncbi:D(4) dopamine receptor isoform X3 [Hyla sarda]|uniref:D(4) dopamine receptor isoform X3 n=1 Tax=Hyla sarda TaxID=327740 RepID=UPI0024C234DD|nr:D(4) dopamine receptor isoform X3 [Hyla sarda]